jgi:hypothetical protein
MYETVTRIVWLKSFLYEIGQGRFISTQCVIHADNRGAMYIAKKIMLYLTGENTST